MCRNTQKPIKLWTLTETNLVLSVESLEGNFTVHLLPNDGIFRCLVLGFSLHADHLDTARVQRGRDTDLKHKNQAKNEVKFYLLAFLCALLYDNV